MPTDIARYSIELFKRDGEGIEQILSTEVDILTAMLTDGLPAVKSAYAEQGASRADFRGGVGTGGDSDCRSSRIRP
jgi:hypothetical protein